MESQDLLRWSSEAGRNVLEYLEKPEESKGIPANAGGWQFLINQSGLRGY